MVKDHLNANPAAANAIPDEHTDAIHQEIATQVTNGLKDHATSQGGIQGLLSSLEGSLSSGSPAVSAIEGGLVSSLTSKFGLPPSVTGAIAGMLPGLLQKFSSKANDPNDPSVTHQTMSTGLFGGMGGGLSSLLGKL